MYFHQLKKGDRRSAILLGATDCAVGLGLRLFLSRSNRIETAWF